MQYYYKSGKQINDNLLSYLDHRILNGNVDIKPPIDDGKHLTFNHIKLDQKDNIVLVNVKKNSKGVKIPIYRKKISSNILKNMGKYPDEKYDMLSLRLNVADLKIDGKSVIKVTDTEYTWLSPRYICQMGNNNESFNSVDIFLNEKKVTFKEIDVSYDNLLTFVLKCLINIYGDELRWLTSILYIKFKQQKILRDMLIKLNKRYIIYRGDSDGLINNYYGKILMGLIVLFNSEQDLLQLYGIHKIKNIDGSPVQMGPKKYRADETICNKYGQSTNYITVTTHNVLTSEYGNYIETYINDYKNPPNPAITDSKFIRINDKERYEDLVNIYKRYYKSDIICLQECNNPGIFLRIVNDLNPETNYSMEYHQHTLNNKDNAVIIYNNDRFNIDKKTIKKNMNGKPGLFIKFEDTYTNKSLYVGTLHKARKNASELFFPDIVETVSGYLIPIIKNTDLPTIITGDYNILDPSTDIVTEARQPQNKKSRKIDYIQYNQFKRNNITGFKQGNVVSPLFTYNDRTTMPYYTFTDGEITITPEQYLDTEFMLSDHLPFMVTLQYK
jgi:exonuclease III